MSPRLKKRLFIGLGANLTPQGYDNPRQGCLAALKTLADRGVEITAISRWYESAPVPMSDQPWYLNAVAMAETRLLPADTLAALHQTEADFGRVRGQVNAARVLDLDLLDFDGQINHDDRLTLPHPRLHLRAFVLLPLQELAAAWRHPETGLPIDELVGQIPPDQQIRLAT